MSDDVQFEPIRGLPEALPAGETILWQGAPDWKALAIDAFHVRAIAVYSALLIAWRTATILHDGGNVAVAAIAAAWLVLLPVAAIAILCVLAWATSASTVYTITDRRVVMRIGIALTVTINLPFRTISAAAYKPSWFGAGNVPIALSGQDKIAYLVLWPHARPLVFKRPQPMLRAVPDGEHVANVLARALAANAHQPARRVERSAERGLAPAGRPVIAG